MPRTPSAKIDTLSCDILTALPAASKRPKHMIANARRSVSGSIHTPAELSNILGRWRARAETPIRFNFQVSLNKRDYHLLMYPKCIDTTTSFLGFTQSILGISMERAQRLNRPQRCEKPSSCQCACLGNRPNRSWSDSKGLSVLSDTSVRKRVWSLPLVIFFDVAVQHTSVVLYTHGRLLH